jgi:hypothetical protein
MATILTKRSNTASSVPLAADLTNSTSGAELAVNTADKKLYVKDGSGNVVELTGLKSTDIGVSVQAYDAQLNTLATASADRATFLASEQAFSMRNRIINGDMRIDQRNAGASVAVTTAGQYTLDRWAVASPTSFGGQLTAQRSTTAPTGFTNSLSLTATTADSSIGATEYYSCIQRLEGFNVADFGWGAAGASTVTLSFWVRASIAGTYSGSLRNSASDRSYVFEYSISSANTWEYKTIQIAGDTTGTWLKDNGVGIDLWWSVGTGSTYKSSTVGSWQAGAYLASTNQTQLISTSGATFYITGVQLEAGTVATPFERRPYGTELALCQRYYQESRTASGYGNASSSIQASVSLVVSMRASPSVSKTSGNMQFTDGANNYQTSSAPSSYFGNSSGGSLNQGGYTGLTTFRPIVMDGQSSFAAYTFSAEL